MSNSKGRTGRVRIGLVCSAMHKASAQTRQRAQVAQASLISVVGLAVVSCGGNSPQAQQEEKQPVTTSVEEIRAMFAENQIGGAQFFETRKAVLTGEVVRVREALGAGILVFKSAKSGVEADLAFGAQGTKSLGSLKSGNRVEVTCPTIEEVLGQVLIVCSSVSVLETGAANGK